MSTLSRAHTLSGREVADAVAVRLRDRVAGLTYRPRLVFVRVGEDPASVFYVRSKQRFAERIGVDAQTLVLPESSDQATLMRTIDALNEDPNTDGILVQLPLPRHLDAGPVLEAIDPAKDVDGFHPINVGRLWAGEPALVPCTPLGLLAIMDHYQLPVEGRHVVVVGRSHMVGKPAAALFLARHATVTVAHSRTRDLGAVVAAGDVVVAAVGRAGLITAAMVKPGAVVLDVGMTRVGEGIVGDVDAGVWQVAGHMTPMPGGTGLVTVAMVLENTLTAAERRRT